MNRVSKSLTNYNWLLQGYVSLRHDIHPYIILGRSSGGLSFIAFLCINLKKFPNFSGSQGGPDQDTSPKEGLSPLVLPQPNSTYERNSVNNIISHNDLLKLNVIKKLRLKILQKENTNWLPWTKELHHGYYWLYYSFLFFNIEFLTRQAKSRDMALAKTSICSSMKTKKKNRET